MISEEITQNYGKAITPKELAEFLGVDPRTIKKYYYLWGGIEISPGIIRFFEYRIKEILNAKFDKKKGEITLPGKHYGKRRNETENIPGCIKNLEKGSDNLGKRRKGKNGKTKVHDKFGIFNDC